MITKLQKLYIPPRNLFLKKPLCTGNLLPERKIIIERPGCTVSLKNGENDKKI